MKYVAGLLIFLFMLGAFVDLGIALARTPFHTTEELAPLERNVRLHAPALQVVAEPF